MNPQGKCGAFAPTQQTSSTRAMSTGRAVHAGARAPVPPVYGSGRPAFSPPTVLRGRGRIFPAPARGTPHPRDRRAISVQLAPATSGLSRSLPDTPTRRSGHVEPRSRTDSQADSAGPLRYPCKVSAVQIRRPRTRLALIRDTVWPTAVITFIALKLAMVITWSWWWVLSPLWGGLVLNVLAVGGLLAVAVSYPSGSRLRKSRNT
jgi:hypothetical protein